jgi:uncharacterized protein YbjT (DUF2867 family)
MNVLLFGATGMVGLGVLRECLLDPEVRRVVSIGRTPSGVTNPKLHDIVVTDLFKIADSDLTGFDACFFCLGTTAAGKSEEAYSRVTYDLTLSIARTLARLNPQMTFIYVSGAGTDSTERGRTMWARVKGKTENALLQLPFKAAWMFRPAVIQPLHGIRSKTRLYQMFYSLTGPIFPLLKRMFSRFITTTEQVGRAMLIVAKRGAPGRILETEDINRL